MVGRVPNMLGLFGAALGGAAAGAVAIAVLSVAAGANELRFVFGATIYWFFGLTIVSIVAFPSAGGLIHAGFQAAGIRNGLAYCIAGAVAGVIVAEGVNVLIVIGLGGSPSPPDLIAGAPIYGGAAIAGASTALFAWIIRRPDRDAPANPPTSSP